MNGLIGVQNSKANRIGKSTLFSPFGESAGLFLVAVMFIVGTFVAIGFNLPVKGIMANYSYDVLVILIVMELFTNLIAETGIMQLIAIKIAEKSKGQKRMCLMLFGGMMFLISSCLNNITAVMMILPIVFVLLKTLEVDRKYVCTFFAIILALSNTGGAASPVGDFPAIVIMTSGITSFLSYLTHAFPLFAMTSLILLVLWGISVKKEKDDGAIRKLAIANLKSQYKNMRIRYDVLVCLGIVFLGMFLAWSFIPQSVIPPEIIAVLGYVIAMVICSLKKIRVNQGMELKSVLTIASFLFFAEVVSESGLLRILAEYLQDNISNPKLLVMAIMLITSIIAGIFSAGPAAAAMMPIIVELCNGPLNAQSDWIAVAYAASICAGSSLFMWSATAGFILSGKVNKAGIVDGGEQRITWGIREYLKYGIVNYFVQIAIAMAAIVYVL